MEQHVRPRSTKTPDQGVRLVNDLGSGFMVQVWEDCHPAVRASLNIEEGTGGYAALMADHTEGTIHERQAFAWALRTRLANRPGFYVLFV